MRTLSLARSGLMNLTTRTVHPTWIAWIHVLNPPGSAPSASTGRGRAAPLVELAPRVAIDDVQAESGADVDMGRLQ